MTEWHHYKEEDKVLVAVDCIIFGVDKEGLKILLIKRGFAPEKGQWSLMGGFLKRNETLHEAANRVLFSLTGLSNIYMEQLHSYSKVHRDPKARTVWGQRSVQLGLDPDAYRTCYALALSRLA